MKLSRYAAQWGALFALVSALLFSSKAIFIKQAYAIAPNLDAITLMAIRMLSALPFFLLICWFFRKKMSEIGLKEWAYLIFVGLLGFISPVGFDFFGLMFISATLERIILFLYPTLTVIASSFIFKQKLRPKVIFALILSYGGTILVMLQEQQSLTEQGNFWLGASLVFASAVTFACYLLLTPPLIQKFGSWHLTGLTLSAACIGTLLHFFIATPQPIQLLSQLPISIYWYGICLGLMVTVLPTILLVLSIEYLGSSQSAMISAISPILTILLAVLFLNEHLNAVQWFGCLLNILGVMMVTLSKKRLMD